LKSKQFFYRKIKQKSLILQRDKHVLTQNFSNVLVNYESAFSLVQLFISKSVWLNFSKNASSKEYMCSKEIG